MAEVRAWKLVPVPLFPALRARPLVGLNARCVPWEYDGRPATALARAHFARLRPALAAGVGLAPPAHRGTP